ncbi:MAG TPA: phage tail length tape measure family protein, partial [Tepidisphaeraceae bacterium]|nr:phage tail length tape measure family protein [Tepidisphaeraceae bacterium]
MLLADASGVVGAGDQSTVAMDKVAVSAKAAGDAGTQMAAGIDAAKLATDGLARSASLAATVTQAGTEAQVQQIAKLTQVSAANISATESVSALAAAQSAYNTTVAQARVLLASGLLSEQGYAQAVEGATAKLALSRAMHDLSSTSLRAEAAAAAAVGAALAGFGEAEVAAGTNTAAFTELIRAASREAGVGREKFAALHASWELLADNPVAAIIAAAAVATVAGVVAWDLYDTAERRVEGTAVSLGNIFNLSRQQLAAFADQIAEAADVSERSGTQMESSFLSANLSPDLWNAAVTASMHLANVWRTDVPAAAQKLAEALKDPKGAGEQLLSSLNALDPQIKQLIDDLTERGNSDQAADKILERVNQQLRDMPDTSSNISRVFHQMEADLGTMVSNAGKLFDTLTNFQPPAWLLFLERQANVAANLASGNLLGAGAAATVPNASTPDATVSVTGEPGGAISSITSDLARRQNQLAQDSNTIDQYQQRIDSVKNSIHNLNVVLIDE